MCVMEIPEERERGTEEIFQIISTENFSKLMSDNKPDPGSSENIKQYSAKKTPNLRPSFSNYRTLKIKKKS